LRLDEEGNHVLALLEVAAVVHRFELGLERADAHAVPGPLPGTMADS